MLCNFAHDFPAFVEDLLEKEAGLRRRFREETISDLWVGSLVAMHSFGVYVDLADEAVTGADIEIWFLSKNRKYGVGFVIQAKRSHCSTRKRNHKACEIDWRRHRFQELDHAAGKRRPKGSQSRDLTRAAEQSGRRVYPLYAFYNPKHVRQGSGHVEGVMLADAFEVRKRMVLGRKLAWKKRLTLAGGKLRKGPADYKRLENLEDLFFPLSTMFCTGRWTDILNMAPRPYTEQTLLLRLATNKIEIANLPDPYDVVEAMREGLQRKEVVSGSERTASEILPEVTDDLPFDIVQLASGAIETKDDIPVRGSVARNRIVFVANNYRVESEPY